MVTLTPAIRAAGEKIHAEHESLARQLDQLEAALDGLICHSEVRANLATGEQVRRFGRQLVEEFPEHCRREEAGVLEPVSSVSPELNEFCSQMKVEHFELLLRLSSFRAALEDFERESTDLYLAICRLKEAGKELAEDMRRHVAREEHELSGFL